MTLKSDIAEWDTKAVKDIEGVYDEHAGSRGFLNRVIRFAPDPDLQVGATWLLKRHCETVDGAVTPDLADELYAGVGRLTRWEARLHVLQCMAYIPVPGKRARVVARFLDTCLSDENTFVRAWAYTGYAELARAHPRYREEAAALLEDALERETKASVLARVRRTLKKGFGKT